jgi:Tetratricopeptide repeat
LEEAEKFQAQVMRTIARVLGPGVPSTLTIMGNLASTFQDKGRWIVAEKMEAQVMEMRRRVLGSEHPATLTSMANLAFT